MSETSEIENERREFLTHATAATAAVGVAAAAVPFVQYWSPSAAAEDAAGPVEVDLSTLEPGQQLTVAWRGKPVWVIRRTPEMLEEIDEINSSDLRDPLSKVDQQPAYAQNLYRSINPEYLVLVGLCTHLGCSPTYRPDVGSVKATWPGGFYCSCHGSTFDLSGRVYKGVPAPSNLEVPPYHFSNEKTLIIGESKA